MIEMRLNSPVDTYTEIKDLSEYRQWGSVNQYLISYVTASYIRRLLWKRWSGGTRILTGRNVNPMFG
jgi:hypothetical protein